MKKSLLEKLSLLILILTVILNMFTVNHANATVADGSEDVALQIAREGIVLLKNENNALPFSNENVDKIAVFGQGQIYPGEDSNGCSITTKGFQIAGTTSSGAVPVNVIDPHTALKNLEEENRVELYDELSDKYIADMEYIPDDEMYSAVGENADTAVVILTRFPNTAIIMPESTWYLTQDEKDMLQKLTTLKEEGKLNKIVVLLNIGTSIDTSWAKDGNSDNIDVDAIMSVWYPGQQGGQAIADILIGDVNPSGKLSYTYAKSIDDYPVEISATSDDEYTEDIYVGYRYFETFGVDVSYPFGFGLSYTDFEFGQPVYSVSGDEIKVTVDVTNKGNMPGKEVVQVYFSAPQKGVGDAVLSKSSIELATFEKTGLIQPGETEKVELRYSIKDMSSYDDEGVTGKKSAYVLEAGDYKVFVGNSIKDAQTRQAGVYNIPALTVTEQLRRYLAPQKEFEKIVVENNNGIITEGRQKVKTDVSDLVADREYTPYNGEISEKVISFTEVLKGNITFEQFVSQMSIEELANLAVGQPATEPAYGAKGSFGAGNVINEKYDIPAADTFNASCGLVIGTKGTSWGSKIMVACTWNRELSYALGEGMGKEAVLSGADVLLSNGVDIPRHPLNGGNIIYFSEDPYLTGVMGAEETLGTVSTGVSNTLKTFALYNKRQPKSHNSIVSERAAREIYLKGFEITVKTVVGNDAPLGIMASYNYINNQYSIERKDLMTGILRNEWGYDGIVVTDWGVGADTSLGLMAGSNIKMPPGNTYNADRQSYINDLKDAVENGEMTRNNLEMNAVEVLKFLSKLPDSWIDIVPMSRIYVSSVYASKADKPQTISRICDGDVNTGWSSRESSSASPNLNKTRLVVDLGRKTNIKLIEFVPGIASSMRKNFSFYLSNENDFTDKKQIYIIDGEAVKGKTYRISTDENKYRYVVFESNEPNFNAGLAELKVYTKAEDVVWENNSLINLSDLSSENHIKDSGSWGGTKKDTLTDMSNNSVYITSKGGFSGKQYVFIDLEKQKKIDSVALTMSTSGGMGDGATPEDLRTDFCIVASNDNDFKSTADETVLIRYEGTLAKDNGDTSDLCVFEIPDEYKNKEYRYIGIRKNPTSNNNNVGQICIAEMSVYGKAANYQTCFSKPQISFDSASGEVVISNVARTLEDREYKFIVSGYDENGAVTEVKTVPLKKAGETVRDENGSEIQGINYASLISKIVTFDNPEKVSRIKVMLIDDLGNLTPVTDYTDFNL